MADRQTYERDALVTDATTMFVDETRSHIELTGKDRAKFLHNFCTNDILKLAAGQGCEAFVCNVKGRILGFITVFVGDNSLWIETVPGAAAGLIAHLDRYLIREEVTLTDQSANVTEILLTGPQARTMLSAVFGDVSATNDWPLYQTETASLNGVRVARIDTLGDPTWLLIAPRAAAPILVQQLEAAGAERGSPEFVESLRIAAGFPHYGRDISEDHLAQEVGRTKRSISFTKGCYLGQEPIARLDALGHTNRELRRIRSDSATSVVVGAVLRDADGTQDIGIITSAAPAPNGVGSVAIGYLKSRWTASGSRVLVTCEAGMIEAVVQ